MANKVCDFCLSDMSGVFNRPTKLLDGHQICRKCKAKIEEYDLPVKYEIFQELVTAQPNLRDMIMDTYLESHGHAETLAKYYPEPSIKLHDGEKCISAIPASIRVNVTDVPEGFAVINISEVGRNEINNIANAPSDDKRITTVIEGTLYETDVAIYFMSDHIINCHRLGYVERNNDIEDQIIVKTKKYTYIYDVEHADLFFMRERFYRKVNAVANNKHQHLIYIKNANEMKITPGIYEIPRSLKPGTYKVTAVRDAGLHVKDAIGRVKDYYETDECIDLSEGGVLECTGEYELKWVGDSKKK